MSANMIEIFLFVNPLGDECFESGKTIINFSNNRSEKINIRFIPYVNFKVISDQLDKAKNQAKSLSNRNKLFDQCYNASLAFQAASMQGKRKGYTFFLDLQKHIFDDEIELTDELIEQTAGEQKIDMTMFLSDWDSDLAKQAFSRDQKLAHEMSIDNTPSCVIYNHTNDVYGYRIESLIEETMLHSLCDATPKENTELKENLNKNKFYIL